MNSIFNEERDDMPDYINRISDIINKRVDELLEKRIEDFKEVKERQKNFDELIARKNEEIERYKEDAVQARSEAAKYISARDEALRAKAEVLFDGWDKEPYAYMLHSALRSIQCPVCKGDGYIEKEVDELRGVFDCPLCRDKSHYSGYYTPTYTEFYVREVELGKNNVMLKMNDSGRVYPVIYDSYKDKVEILDAAFKSKEEAERIASEKSKLSLANAVKSFISRLDSNEAAKKFIPEDTMKEIETMRNM